MTFDVAAAAYDRFMGVYSGPLARSFASLLDLQPGQRVLDVGCGPGALTAELVTRFGGPAVSAVDPSLPFVEAARSRFPGTDVQLASAEQLPYADDTFHAAGAQLVVLFMADPVAGVAEMRRVTRPGGTVAACVWDHATGGGPLSTFWAAAKQLDADAPDESQLTGVAEGQLVALFEQLGLREVTETVLEVHADFPSIDAWWELYTLGVGPAGAYVARLDDRARVELRDKCSSLLGPGPIRIRARAWTAVGRV